MTDDASTTPSDQRGAHDGKIVVAVGLVVRLLLIGFGRTTVTDSFYLQGAWLLGEGRSPYLDFTLVAFPGIEALYAAAFRIARTMASASILSGIAVIVTGVLLTRIVRDRLWGRRAWIAGVLYVTAAPVIAFHGFERELWSALFLSAAYLTALRTNGSDLRASLAGLFLFLAMAAKLTAAVGAIALAIELVRRKATRAALVSAAIAAGALLCASLLLRARYGDVFTHQVYYFFFFKGEAASLSERAGVFLRHIDPNLALGFIAMVWILTRRSGARGRVAAVTLLLYGGFYALSPSLWDHNLIDFAWPAAMAGSVLLGQIHSARIAAILVLLSIAVGARGVGPTRPAWFPHGLGAPPADAIHAQADFLADHSRPGQLVIAPTPMPCTIAGRESLSFDPELQPVALALTEELRRHGVRSTWARRMDGVLLGAPRGVREPAQHGPLFSARRDAAALFHILPRLIDAIRLNEPTVVITPLPPVLIETLEAAGYVFEHRDHVRGYYRP